LHDLPVLLFLHGGGWSNGRGKFLLNHPIMRSIPAQSTLSPPTPYPSISFGVTTTWNMPSGPHR
jgi:hypothetical protein